MTAKAVRTTERTWQKLRSEAYRKQLPIKDVLDQIMEGKADPTKLEIL
jgi:hypothetical protein